MSATKKTKEEPIEEQAEEDKPEETSETGEG